LFLGVILGLSTAQYNAVMATPVKPDPNQPSLFDK
jgi:hypothetical protein